jgi:ATP-dependent protease ClpP protease subunit
MKRPKGDLEEDFVEIPSVNIIHKEATPYDTIDRQSFNPATREIFVDGTIDEDFGAWFHGIHRYFIQDNAKDITVWLNTPGGDVQSMFMFYDIVKTSPVKITVIGHGQVCSAGVLMLACGNKRLVTENCVMMIHQYSVEESGGGRYQETKDRRKWADWTHLRMIELYAKCTPEQFDVRYWKGIFERRDEYWILGGQSIVEHGLADEVYKG